MKRDQPVTNCEPCRQFAAQHPWTGERHEGTNLVSPITCAFDTTGAFTTPNWNCVSLDPIRDAAFRVEVGNEDQHLAILRLKEYGFMVVGYYKHRGETELLLVITDAAPRSAALADLAEVAL